MIEWMGTVRKLCNIAFIAIIVGVWIFVAHFVYIKYFTDATIMFITTFFLTLVYLIFKGD